MNYNPKKLQEFSWSQSFMKHFDINSKDQEIYHRSFHKQFQRNLHNSYQGDFYHQTPYPQSFSRNHYSESNQLLKCDECPKFFCSAEYLAIHKQNKHPKNEIIYIEIPSSTLSRPLNATVQNPNLSFDEKKPIPETFCETCQRNFCNKYFLVKHKRTVHGIRDEPIECSNSMENTASPTDRQSVHSNSSMARKNWVCHICKQEYYSFKYLKNHFKKKHNSDEPIKHSESILVTDNKFMYDIRRHILFRLRKRMSKKLIKYGISKKLRLDIRLSSMIKLLEFQKSSFGPFYKNKKWRKNYKTHILNYTKKYTIKNNYLHKSNLMQKFCIEFENYSIPIMVSKINFPKEIQLSVKTPIRENISANIVLKPISKKLNYLFKDKLKKTY